MCDEAQLPNIQAQTGLMTGRHLGEVLQYHTRVYSDLSMSFICDAAMTQLKFFSSCMTLFLVLKIQWQMVSALREP